MAAATWYVILSISAIIVPTVWALLQLQGKQPAKSVRIAVPIIIAAISTAAFISGRVTNGQQNRQLAALKPRSVSDQQRARLKQRLPKNIPAIRIVYRLMDGEGKDYSEQLASAIRQAGGTVASIAGNSLADLPGKVTVVVNSGEMTTQSAADHLCTILTSIGIECGGEISPGQLSGSPAQGEIILVVGRKP